MSIYIHIPFCNCICSYCDFSKFFYQKERAHNYLLALEKEIKENYKQQPIHTIYIGGGTPSCLTYSQLEYLLKMTDYFIKLENIEFTIEINPDMELDKIPLLQKYGINRVSIGMQTTHSKHLEELNRYHTKEQIKRLVIALKQANIQNINIDLMYALPNETLEEVKEDLDFVLQLQIPHISTYSLIIEPHTKLYIEKINPIDEDLDFSMYQSIIKKLEENHYLHYETSNFAKGGYESKHNLVYWNNLEYYGFGIGASGYINNTRYDNTRSYQNYMAGDICYESHSLSKKEQIENEFILGFRKVDGISILEFERKYHMNIFCIKAVNQLLQENKLLLENDYLKIHPDYLYIANTILVNFIDLDINN